MTGGSYLGHTQWAVAPYADPPLLSVCLNITAARFSAAFFQHGVPSLQNVLNWIGLIGRQERGLHSVLPNPRQLARMRRALRKIPLQAADVEVAGAPVSFWRDFTSHASPGDEFWAGADHDRADLTRLPPVSMVTGWWDLFVPLQLRDFVAIRAAGGTARITVGPWLRGEPGKQVDNRAIEARPDVLTYTTDPLPGRQDLVGPVSARIFVRTGRRNADLFVRVCDVDEKGVSRNIVDGIRRLSPQTVPADDVQSGDDRVLAIQVELYPTAYRVQAGHRIRVQVSGGAFPRFARNFGTGRLFATATSAVRCRFEIHHDSRRPSCVLVPVLPGPQPRAGLRPIPA